MSQADRIFVPACLRKDNPDWTGVTGLFSRPGIADDSSSPGSEPESPLHANKPNGDGHADTSFGDVSIEEVQNHAQELMPEVIQQVAGLYQLFWDATRFEPNNSSPSAQTITPGLPQQHTIIPATDVDWVKFTLSATSDIIVETFGPIGDTRMWLYDANLDEIEFDDDDGNGNFSKISRSLASGTYYVKVDEFGNNDELSPYYISLTVNQPVSTTWTVPPPVSVIGGENFTVRWTTTGNPDHVNVHWNPTDPTSSGCCLGPANSTNDSSFSPTSSPATLTAPTIHSDGTPITAPTTVKYVVHARDTVTGDEAYSTVAMVTVSPAPEAGTLAVSPGTGLSSAGQFGGPFNPSSQIYTLTNIGETSINWTAGKTQSWVTLSKSSGTLAAGGQDQVTVSINSGANSLAAGGSPYSDTVTFANTTNSNGSQTRIVSLTIISVVGHTLNITNTASGTPNPVIPRGTADLSVTATDSLGHALGYAWTASCPTLSSNGNFTGSATRTPTWLAPENDTGSLQNCTLQVTVSDGLELSQQSSYSHGVNPGRATSLSIVDGIRLLEPPPYELNGTATVEATIKNTGSATVVLDRFQAIGEFTDQFGSVYQRTWPAEQFQPPLSLAPGASHQYTKLLTDSFPALATTAVVMIHVKFDNIAGQQPITNAESGATAQFVFEVGHTLNITSGPAGDPDPVISGGAVNLSVATTDSLGHQPGYAWEASCPGLGANGTFNSTTIRTPMWTAPTNMTGTPQQCTIQVAVNDGTGLSQVGSYFQEVTQGVASCSYSLSSTSKSFSPSAGSSSVNVTAPSGCGWTAVSNDAWISITSVTNSDGDGTVNYAVAGNTVTIFRTGTLTIAGQTFTVTQTGSCSYSLSHTSQLFGPDGGTDSLNVTAPSGCPWTAVSNDAWLTITSGSSGSDSGTVSYSVATNTAVSQRSGTITIQNQTFTVIQAGVGNDENFALVVNARTVSVIDLDTDSVTGTVSLGNEAAGYAAAITPDGTKAYVTTDSPLSVTVIDTTADTVVDTITGIGSAGFIAVTPDGTKAYVSMIGTSSVAVIDIVTGTVSDPIPGMVNPKGIAMRVLPDLTISANVASSYTSGQAGVQIPVTVYRSGGNLTSGTYVPVRLFWSTDPTWDTGDSQLWESNGSTPDYPISDLNTNGSKTVTATVNIPNIPGGTYYIIAFVDLPTNSFPSGFHTESNENNNTTSYPVSIPQQTGSLQVTLSPQGAINAGAQWRVNGGPWRNSGNTQSGLSIGNHTVEYKAISGWTTPGSQVITISNGQTTTTSGTYIAHICGTGPFDQAEDWVLMDEVVTGVKNYRATYLLEAGPAFTISSTGCVHFSAGEQVILHPGFRVERGGRLVVHVEP